MPYFESLVESGRNKQERADELRRRGGVERNRPTFDLTLAVHFKRQRPAPVVVDSHAELSQGVDDRAEWALPRARVSVELDVA